MAQAAACAGNHNPLAWLGFAAFQGCVDGDAGAEKGRGLGRREVFGDRGYVVSWACRVLLECARGVVAGDFLVEADSVCACVAWVCVLLYLMNWSKRKDFSFSFS